MVSKLTVMYFVTHQVEFFFLVLPECVIEFELLTISNMKKYLKYFLPSFYSQYVPLLLSVMLNGSIKSKITLKWLQKSNTGKNLTTFPQSLRAFLFFCA